MNKLEKILAQSVTPEMVAEQLTEQEIEEVIEEYELKIEGAKKEIERAVDMEEANMKQAEKFQALANDWKAVAEEEKEKLKTWRSVVEKAKQALKSNVDELSPNKRRAELIDEAKRFVETNTKKRKIFTSVGNWYAFDYYGRLVNERFVISESKKTIKLEIVGAINPVVYKEGVAHCHPDDVWNEHIGKAIALGRALGVGVDISKFESAPQPSKIVEGMDVEFFSASRGLYKRGRIKEYNEKDDYVILEDGYELGEDAKPNNVVLIASSNYRILSDTKAKYSDSDE